MDYLTTKSEYPLNLPPYHMGELWHGYLNRVARENNLPGAEYMLTHFVDIDKVGDKNVDYTYDSFGAAFSFIQIENMNMSDLILSGTIFSGEAPLEDKLSTAFRVYRWNLSIGAKSAVTGQNKAQLTELRICPECRREEGEEWYFHTDLQMPMVKVCPKHGCGLLQYTGKPFMEHFDESFTPYDITRADEPLSSFIVDFFNLELSCSCTEVKNAVLRVMHSLEVNLLDASNVSYPKAGILRDLLPSPFDFYHSSYFRLPEYKAFPLMTYMFETAEMFYYKVDEFPSWADEFMVALDGNYELLSDYRETIVTLKCNKCGKTFVSTPKSILIGLGCPHCNQNIGERELYDRMVATHSHNRHIPLMPSHGNLFTVNYIDKKTNEKKAAAARRYFNEEFDNNALLATLKKETESTGHYTLLEYCSSENDYFINLHLRHNRCGGDFWVYRNQFLISSYCRYCGKFRNENTEFNKKLRKIDSSFQIVGQYFYNHAKVSNGEVTFEGLPLTVLHEVERYVRGDEPIRKPSPKDENLYQRVEELFKERKGCLVSTKELYALGTRERVHGCIRTMRDGKKIKNVISGYYSNFSDSFSIEYLQNELYSKNGEIGVPVCDSALVYIGEMRRTDRPAYILKNKGKTTTHGRKELGEPNLFDIPEVIKEGFNFNALMVVGSISHQTCFSTKSKRGKDERLLALLGYALAHGTSIDVIRWTALPFSVQTYNKVEKLYKEYCDGKTDV